MTQLCRQHGPKIRAQLHEHGLRATPARVVLLDIFTHTATPLTIKAVLNRLPSQGVDLATIYRNIETFLSLGIVRRIHLGRHTSYELEAMTHHHHVICERCGRVADLPGCKLQQPAATPIKDFPVIHHHSLEFFGLCRSCTQ